MKKVGNAQFQGGNFSTKQHCTVASSSYVKITPSPDKTRILSNLSAVIVNFCDTRHLLPHGDGFNQQPTWRTLLTLINLSQWRALSNFKRGLHAPGY